MTFEDLPAAHEEAVAIREVEGVKRGWHGSQRHRIISNNLCYKLLCIFTRFPLLIAFCIVFTAHAR